MAKRVSPLGAGQGASIDKTEEFLVAKQTALKYKDPSRR